MKLREGNSTHQPLFPHPIIKITPCWEITKIIIFVVKLLLQGRHEDTTMDEQNYELKLNNKKKLAQTKHQTLFRLSWCCILPLSTLSTLSTRSNQIKATTFFSSKRKNRNQQLPNSRTIYCSRKLRLHPPPETTALHPAPTPLLNHRLPAIFE